MFVDVAVGGFIFGLGLCVAVALVIIGAHIIADVRDKRQYAQDMREWAEHEQERRNEMLGKGKDK